ncbi:hypothetical protein VIBHAR_00218 [Vibrio campbellii ATCC BAA-1116]|uniref:Uncharacterized protein n=1 Tax=Vibrio campbellii (strain ATCC BAA-1116) TaxID=2902295 RepID=A7N074_VIBC1|nr:hypothetical protein VIBHAR_00218 [Vibrio campbellii ATCC BAA-1116]
MIDQILPELYSLAFQIKNLNFRKKIPALKAGI